MATKECIDLVSILSVNIFKLTSIFLIAYIGGLLVKYKGVRVNYTRKVNHFLLFFIPAFVDKLFICNESAAYCISEAIFTFGSFIIFIKPVRESVFFIKTAFSSFDRPEDRPYTLTWYVTQELLGYAVIMSAIAIYEKYNIINLLSIPILVSVFGDGLAEPIGVRFGRIKYSAYALFTKRKYTRSLEGSLAVFVSSILITSLFYPNFNPVQFMVALLAIPLTMTLSEAFAPHSWDNPLMCLAGFTIIFFIKHFL
jgi:phytol kinase